jgi:condensin complex subunit 1
LLERVLFAAGHLGLKQLVHLDYIECELKRRRAREEELRDNQKSATGSSSSSGSGGGTTDNADTSNSAGAKGKTPPSSSSNSGGNGDMGVGGGTAEDDDAEMMQRIAETELLLSPAALLASYAPMVVAVCTRMAAGEAEGVFPPGLQTAASLALCKFMCVSSTFCDTHLPLLFTVLQAARQPEIRTNCMIALGDLAVRFPNLLEPWTAHLYGRLRDADARVRKTALMVMTHLILNDMVKVKGQISEMAVCLGDKDPRIADLAHVFFSELSHKVFSGVFFPVKKQLLTFLFPGQLHLQHFA